MPIEEKLANAKKQVERQIKMELLDKNMTQTELADLIGETRTNVNLAIKGNTNPKSIEIRKKIYKVLGMKQYGKTQFVEGDRVTTTKIILERKLIEMQKKKLPDWETVFGGILLSVMIATFSLLSYWFWSAMTAWIGGKQMKQNKNSRLIVASNALHSFLAFDLKPYAKHGFVKKVQKNKAIFQLPHRVDSFSR